MAIFSKFKGNKEKKDAKPVDKPPAPRVPYIPQYAVRDALQCAPAAWKNEDPEVYRRANEQRIARENSEMSMPGWSTNPKMSPRMSRASSFVTMPTPEGSRPASRRYSNPFNSGSSSYQSIPGLLHNNPPVPTIPTQYASHNVSAGPSTPRSISRNSSFQAKSQMQSLEGQFQSDVRPVAAYRNSYTGQGSSPKKSSPLASVEASPIESHEETQAQSVNLSSAASTSSNSSGEAVEIPARHDSPQMRSPISPNMDRVYPSDPRKLGKAPVIDIEEEKPRNYFSHPTQVPTINANMPPPNAKRQRFSLIRRSRAVPAH